MTMLVAYVDSTYTFQYCNEPFARFFNQNPGQLVGQKVVDAVGDPVWLQSQPSMDRALSGETFEFEGWIHYDIPGLPPSAHYMQAKYQCVRDEKNQVTGFFIMANDLTVIRQSDERFQTMADSAPVLVWISNREKLCTWFNKGWLEFTGRTLEEEYGNGWADGVHPEDYQRCLDIYVSNFDARTEFYMEYRLKHHSGQYRWISDRGVPHYSAAGVFEGFTGGCMDIHDHITSSQRTAANEKLLDQLFSESPAAMSFVAGPEHSYSRANREFYRFTGLDESIIGKPIRSVLPEIESQGFISILDQVYETGEAFVGSETPVRFAGEQGRTKYVDFVYHPLRDESGEIIGVVSQSSEVTAKVEARVQSEKIRGLIANERENFRNLFRQTPEMVCILSGPEHLFEFVNDAHERVLGFNATGMTVRLAQPESIEVHGILDNVYRTGVTAELNEIAVTVSDRLRYFNLTFAARRSETGEVNGVMILGTEVTESVQIRESILQSQKRYQQVFDYSPLPKWVYDRDTLQFVEVNQAAIRHYGYSKEEFLSMKVSDIRPPEDVDILNSALKASYEVGGENINKTFRHLKKDGSIIEVEVSALDIRIDNRKLLIAAIVDVTERSASEKRQAQLLESLRAAKEEAERANELKSAFLANMSHEIRTPLGAMLGFADLLRDPGLSRTEHANYINILTRNGEQLSAIINDILDLSKIEVGHLTLEFTETSTAQIAADVVSLLSVKAKEKDLALEYRPDPSTPVSIVSDPLRVRQVLLNLVGNAIKFTQFGSIRIHSYGELTEGGETVLIFEVTDTGIGIPESQRERIFEMFVQADGTLARRFGGTGLGLALSRQLAIALGGNVAVSRSVEGRGSTFVFKALDQPARQSSTPSESRRSDVRLSEIAADALEGIKVLVVDDSPDNQQLIWHYLNKYGITVDSAEDGYSGYKKAFRGDHDLVLMDIQMPQMDGYTATQKLREAGYRKPIIALTAHAMSEVRKKCFNVGCTDHLTKPIKIDELLAAIARHTAAASARTLS